MLCTIGPPGGRVAIPKHTKGPDESYGFDRLERAVQALADRCRRLRDENARLARDAAEHEQRIAGLESQLREANQLRRDVAKRLDDLIGQIDHLEVQFTARSE